MHVFDAMELPLVGARLVEASAGTGKTHAITTLVVRLVLERGLDIEQILVVTFTEAATAELRARVRSRLRAALAAAEGDDPGDPDLVAIVRRAGADARPRLAVALANIDRAAVFTIHGFCHRTLLDSAFDSGARFDVELCTDTQALRDEVLLDFWTTRLGAASPETLRSLRASGVGLAVSRALFDRVTRSPTLPVLPEPRAPTGAPDGRAFAASVARARASWDAAAIERLLAESTALSGNRYPPKSIAGWCEEVSRFFDGVSDAFSLPPDKLAKLTPESLAGAVKKGFAGREPRHPFFEAAAAVVVEAERYAEDAARHALAFKHELIAYARGELPARKERLGVMGFDDLLSSLAATLAGPWGPRLAASVRTRYPVALIDEFQDTDPTQWAIFRTLYGDADVVLIGDPKQAIYAFRGADVFAYMEAASYVPEAARYTMDVSWRSDPSYVAAVGRLYARVPRPFAFESIGYVPVSARPGATDALRGARALEILFVPRAATQSASRNKATWLADAVAGHIRQLLGGEEGSSLGASVTIDGRRVEAGDVAVLTRTNRQAFEMQRALTRLGLPSVVLGDQSVFEDEQPEARELSLLLAAVVEPTNSQALRTALTTELCGVSALALAAMETEAERGEWDRWVERFRGFAELWQGRGFVQMFRALLHETHMVERLLGLERGERRVTNLLHLVELLQTAASSQHLGPRALLAWLNASRRSELAKLRPEAAQIRLESDAQAIRITTVHRAKGLEYPIVYAPHLSDGRLLFDDDKRDVMFHDPEDGYRGKLDLASLPEHVEAAEHERFAESLRLLYVALTRAKHRAVIVWDARGSSFATSALGYLLHPPPLSAGGVSVAALKSHLKGLGDERMYAELSTLADATIEVGRLDVDRPVACREREGVPPPRLSAREVRAPVTSWWRTASFSWLTAKRASAAPGEGRDRDASFEATDVLERGPAAPITMRDFARGPKAGDFLHDVLEHLDFTDDAAIEPLVADRLRAHGFAPEHRDQVAQGLREALATPLAGTGSPPLRLRDVPTTDRLNEMEFHFPVAHPSPRAVPHGAQLALSFTGPTPSAVGKLTAAKLAEPFLLYGSEALDPRYGHEVERLGFVPIEGYLKGYIDLVFVARGRWYIVDYKSNHLGDDLADYGQPALMAAMARGHYYLQAHLYTVAVHRFLSRRLPGYRYGRHFGGVLYLFLKGMRPGAVDASGRSTGVFFEKPPFARVAHLSRLLSEPPALWGDR